MTNKELILTKINELRFTNKHGDEFEQGYNNALDCIEYFINNSLPAEQPSEEVNKEIDRFLADNVGKTITVGHVAHYFANWQKEQLMKNVVETKVKGCIDGKGIFIDTDIPIGINVNEDDNVKVIIVKEDE